jgi:hypothetical protein
MFKLNLKLVIILLLALLILFGGVLKFLSRNAKEQSSLAFQGSFINFSFLNQVNAKIVSTIPFYAVELNFFRKDSVLINFGFERAKFNLQHFQGKTYIKNAYQNKDLQLLTADSLFFVLVDSAFTGLKENSVFKKIQNPKRNQFVFASALNNEIIAGNYFFDNDRNRAEIKFFDNGKITGLGEFTNYEICISGDCATEVLDSINLISLVLKNGSFEYYGLKKDWNKVDFYKLSPPIVDIKGERKITDLAFTLYKAK